MSRLTKPFKVLYVLRPSSGGIRRHIHSLLTNLAEEVEPILVCPSKEPDLSPFYLPGAPVHYLPITGEFNPFYDVKAILALSRIADTSKAEIIHAHGYKAAALCLGAGIVTCPRVETGKPRFVCTFHNLTPSNQGKIKKKLYRSLISVIGRRADHILTVSRVLQNETQRLLRLPIGKISHIHNGIDLGAFESPYDGEFRRELSISESSPLIGTVARLIPQKGIDCLIEAAVQVKKYLPGLKLVLVGEGPYRSRLEQLVKSYGLEGEFIFTGYREDIPGILKALDVFILPTLEEALSIAVLEAMAAGKPVIATNVGGLPEVITDETGILIPPDNPERLTKAVLYLLTNPEKRKMMGKAGRERVRRFFSVETMAKKHLDIYEQLLGG